MSMRGITGLTRSLLLLLCPFAVLSPASFSQQSPVEPALTPAQAAVIEHHIGRLHSPQDRSVAEAWTDAKKVAEVLCRPAALSEIRTSVPAADRVFLGTDDSHGLTLASNQLLTGVGEFRSPQGWSDFTFSCALDPATGKVTHFQHTLSPHH